MPDIGDFIAWKWLSKSQILLFSLSQNILSIKIPSSNRVITQKSHRVQTKSKVQLEWESQQ